MRSLLNLLRWLLHKGATGLLIAVVAIAGFAVWYYLRDNVGFTQWRQDTLRLINGERTKITSALAGVEQRRAKTAEQIKADQDRLHQADKVIEGIKSLDTTWDRYVADRDRAKQNDARLAEVTALHKSLEDDVAKLQDEFTHLTWERDGLEIALGKLDLQIRAVEQKRSVVMHYLDRAWNAEIGRGFLRLPVRWWVAVLLLAYFVGPTLGKLTLYYGVAPWVSRGRPVRLAPAVESLPTIGESRAAAEVALGAGDHLWVRERFLQASDEGLRRSTRFVLDWRIPITCLATGLVELVEMTNNAADGAADQRVTLSDQKNPHTELAVLTLLPGASIVLRPSFLAGAIVADGRRLQIRRHWQLFRLQAWMTLQFRFFEFVGPCRLVLAGSRGIRVENLADRAGERVPARRTNQDATVGFTPNLAYRPVRAETFWGYYRGMNPLFDDLFTGHGVFLCQQVATEGEAKAARKFWSNVWSGLMKVFGL